MRIAAFVFGMGLLLPSAVRAEGTGTPQIRSATIGFHAQFRNRFWTPLTVEVVNDGPACVGALVVEARGHFAGQMTSLVRPVVLPARSLRQFEFPVLPDLAPTDFVSPEGAPTICTVKLTDGRARVFDKTDVISKPNAEESLFVLVSDNRYSSYKFLNGLVVGAAKRLVSRAVCPPVGIAAACPRSQQRRCARPR